VIQNRPHRPAIAIGEMAVGGMTNQYQMTFHGVQPPSPNHGGRTSADLMPMSIDHLFYLRNFSISILAKKPPRKNPYIWG